MTREQLFQITSEMGLVCATERVTTGVIAGPAFREFEFTGDPARCFAAAVRIRHDWGVGHEFCRSRRSDVDGAIYLLVSSFYCGPAESGT